MKRQAGFSLIEVLAATALMLIVMAATLRTLTDAIHANEGVTLLADTQENLRASLNYMTKDIVQAGEGIPQGGITIPNTGGGAPVSALNRPLPVGAPPPVTFPTNWAALPAIAPGFQLGLASLVANPAIQGATVAGLKTDMITVLYADTTMQDAAGNWLNRFPIRQAPFATCAAAAPSPNGTITTAGNTTTIVFDPTCININTGNTAIKTGDLILLQNNASGCAASGALVASDSCDANNPSNPGSMALLTVTGVNLGANTITFTCGDAFALNCSGLASGTVTQMQTAGSWAGVTVTATRVWMVTYYISNANPLKPMLMRQVNMNAAQPVGEVIENMQIFYDVLNPGSNPPALQIPAENEDPLGTLGFGSLSYIRDCYILLYARSENPYTQSNRYFRNNLQTVVSIRGLDFYNEFN
jgi:prepilin-type N-terminal cleavage/methylation domain-containing protein